MKIIVFTRLTWGTERREAQRNAPWGVARASRGCVDPRPLKFPASTVSLAPANLKTFGGIWRKDRSGE